MHDAATPALQIDGVSFRYGAKTALNDICFTIAPGTFTVLLGPNGAGKTTLFSLITRLYASNQGRISVAGFDLRKTPLPAMAEMGVVFQQPTLDLDLSVLQNLRYHAALRGMGKKDAIQRIEIELRRFDMDERKQEKVRALNGGHRRRVEIARALLHQPRLLLLDEPTIGLDVPTRLAIVNHIHGLCKTDGIAVLWATHLIDEVAPDDHIVLLDSGRVRAQGTTAEILQTAEATTLGDAFTKLTAKVAAS
ncbi:ATP-binding cassette domain-containing protein [Rhodospirillaceae bacterium AH-315-P19]|nr:ATP-binding cassette domain-containing protein [Rhodospirillaceae bacterium AH-315-P19]